MQVLTVDDILSATGGELVSGKATEQITKISIDSRESDKGVLFIPLIGETRDGHSFIASALEKGAMSLTQLDDEYGTGTVIKVRNTRLALGDIAKYYKEKYKIPTVAITGSVGKTTTKDLIYAVLSEKFNTHKTPNNFNNDLGVPLTIFGIEKEHNMAVIEMGMNHYGEISYLANIAKPDCAVITNVGMSHIENLGSREGIFKAKMEIAEGFGPDNTLFVNGDNEYLDSLRDTPYKLIKFGVDEHNDVYAKDIENKGLMGVKFTAVHNGGQFKVWVKQPGVHNVYNALSAICIGLHMGLSEEECARGIENCVYTSSRLEISEHDGIEIINDCYNASPDSVRAALKVLGESLKPRKVAILGDMLEMGEYSDKAHYEIGKDVVGTGVDMLLTAGKAAMEMAKGAKDAGLETVESFGTTDELEKHISQLISSGDCVLIKASHGMHFEKIAAAIKAI